jgi:hypothetical protein
MKIINPFNTWLLAIMLLVYAIMSAGLGFKYPEYNHISLYFIPFIVAVLTGVTHHFLIKFATKKDPRDLINMIMASTGVKLLFYLIMIVVYAFNWPAYSKAFLYVFFSMYATCTFIEVRNLIQYMKKL